MQVCTMVLEMMPPDGSRSVLDPVVYMFPHFKSVP